MVLAKTIFLAMVMPKAVAMAMPKAMALAMGLAMAMSRYDRPWQWPDP